MSTRRAVLDALGRVRDPELDEPITQLGFVAGLDIKYDEVHVRLRLPTYFCAPNFAYLMAAEAKAAVQSVPGIRRARVTLEDHFASGDINAGVEGEDGFEDAFPTQANGGLNELRELFARKAFVARQEKLCRALQDAGYEVQELAALRLEDLPSSADVDDYMQRRAELGLELAPEAPFLVAPTGAAICQDQILSHLRFARTVQLSIEGNSGLCRGLLATRYGIGDFKEVV
jgi:metal-sulfur cluster biosynthetic enzyme